jgi:hypothetical protein
VPFGSIGLTLFGVDLFFPVPDSPPAEFPTAAPTSALGPLFRTASDRNRVALVS